MGLFSKMTNWINAPKTDGAPLSDSPGSSPSGATRPVSPSGHHRVASERASSNGSGGVATIAPPAQSINEPKLGAGAAGRASAIEGAGVTLSKRSRQEIVEEVQQSYKEIVGLVKRVNEHLDRADKRAEEIDRVALRVAEATEKLPEAIAEATGRYHEAQIAALQEIAERQTDGAQRVETTVAQLGVQMEVASQSHEQLVTTMADFRETMGDVSESNARTAVALDASIEQKREADDRLARMIVQNQRWMIGIVAGIMVFAATSLVVAVVAMARIAG